MLGGEKDLFIKIFFLSLKLDILKGSLQNQTFITLPVITPTD